VCVGERSIESSGKRRLWIRVLGRPRHRWGNYIKMDLEVGLDSVKWINLAQCREQ
jgi:maltoporin